MQSYVAEFTTDIRHVPGVDNVVANTLSRPPSHTTGPDSQSHTAGPERSQPALRDQPALHNQPALHIAAVSPSVELLDYVSIAKNQLKCSSTKKAVTSSSLQMLHVNVQGHRLLCDIYRGGQRPLILEVDRKQVFQAFHGLSHLGTQAREALE
jgi:hypothetical protein